MGRDSLLKQIEEKDKAIKEISEKYKSPPNSIKYDLIDDDGKKAGYMEYFTNNDTLVLNNQGLSNIKGNVLRSLRDNLNILLEE